MLDHITWTKADWPILYGFIYPLGESTRIIILVLLNISKNLKTAVAHYRIIIERLTSNYYGLHYSLTIYHVSNKCFKLFVNRHLQNAAGIPTECELLIGAFSKNMNDNNKTICHLKWYPILNLSNVHFVYSIFGFILTQNEIMYTINKTWNTHTDKPILQ